MVAHKVNHYEQPSLNRIKNVSETIFFVNFEHKNIISLY